MDTRNWFGEHAGTIRMIALGGGIVLAAIIIFDVLAQRGKAQAAAAAATTAPTSANGSATDSATGTGSGLLGNGYTDINVFQDYSTHNSSDIGGVTSNSYTPPGRVPVPPRPITTGSTAGGPIPIDTGVGSPNATGGATVPVPTPHPSAHYTVQPGDSLWSIAANHLGGGYNWTELYNWNRSVVGSNPNLIYPGEVLTLN